MVKQTIEKRREVLGLENEILTGKEIKQKHKESVVNWQEFKVKAEKEREKELLDTCSEKMIGDIKVSKKEEENY